MMRFLKKLLGQPGRAALHPNGLRVLSPEEVSAAPEYVRLLGRRKAARGVSLRDDPALCDTAKRIQKYEDDGTAYDVSGYPSDLADSPEQCVLAEPNCADLPHAPAEYRVLAITETTLMPQDDEEGFRRSYGVRSAEDYVQSVAGQFSTSAQVILPSYAILNREMRRQRAGQRFAEDIVRLIWDVRLHEEPSDGTCQRLTSLLNDNVTRPAAFTPFKVRPLTYLPLPGARHHGQVTHLLVLNGPYQLSSLAHLL